MLTTETILFILLAYLTGAFPSAVWVGKIFYKIDIREFGSGNAGATNTFRILGKKAGIPVLLMDIFKGWLAVNYLSFLSEVPSTIENQFEIQLAFGIAAAAAAKGRELRSFSIRKESKDHGVEGRLAGALYPGDKVVICEDTVTRGTSPLEAAQVVRDLGADPVMILPVVDRGGTCGSLAAAENIEFRPLVTAIDLGFPYEGP